MSTTASLPNAHRSRIVAATGALVAAATVTVTLAVANGGSAPDRLHHFR